MENSNELKIHFLNVGHGDCTVIHHPSGRLTVVDTSNGEDIDSSTVECKLGGDVVNRAVYEVWKSRGFSTRRALKEAAAVDLPLKNPVEFIRKQYPNQPIFRYIQTHPELDHMRGLASLDKAFSIYNFWDTRNHRSCDPLDADKADWEAYRSLRSSDKKRNYTRGDRNAYFALDDLGGSGDNLEILSPSEALVSDCDDAGDGGDWNNMSYVIKPTHMNTSIILGGDAGTRAWDDILVNCRSKLPCRILKASHHGRESGYHEEALRAMAPTIAILSIGDECEHEAREKYEKHCKYVWSTYECGTITLTIDANGGITYSFENALAMA